MRRVLAPVARRLRAHAPTREKLAENRYLRPFADRVLRADLWRFNRRSVPRAIALGFFVGVLVPFAHSFIAALTAVFVRGNVPVAIVSTWISNPVTWMLMWPAAYRIGRFLLHFDMATVVQPVAGGMGTAPMDMLHRLTGAGLTTLFGLFVEAVAVAGVGYLVTSLGWRWWISRKRRQRLARSGARAGASSGERLAVGRS